SCRRRCTSSAAWGTWGPSRTCFRRSRLPTEDETRRRPDMFIWNEEREQLLRDVAVLTAQVEDATGQLQQVVEAYNELFDFLADDLGFKAAVVSAINWQGHTYGMQDLISRPRRVLIETPTKPKVGRT